MRGILAPNRRRCLSAGTPSGGWGNGPVPLRTETSHCGGRTATADRLNDAHELVDEDVAPAKRSVCIHREDSGGRGGSRHRPSHCGGRKQVCFEPGSSIRHAPDDARQRTWASATSGGAPAHGWQISFPPRAAAPCRPGGPPSGSAVRGARSGPQKLRHLPSSALANRRSGLTCGAPVDDRRGESHNHHSTRLP